MHINISLEKLQKKIVNAVKDIKQINTELI